MTADELSDMLVEAAAQGCCNNAQWRGHVCTFHQGYQQGVDAAIEAYATFIEETTRPTQIDGAGVTPYPCVHCGSTAPCEHDEDEHSDG